MLSQRPSGKFSDKSSRVDPLLTDQLNYRRLLINVPQHIRLQSSYCSWGIQWYRAPTVTGYILTHAARVPAAHGAYANPEPPSAHGAYADPQHPLIMGICWSRALTAHEAYADPEHLLFVTLQSQEQTHMPRQILWFNLRIKKVWSVIHTILQLL